MRPDRACRTGVLACLAWLGATGGLVAQESVPALEAPPDSPPGDALRVSLADYLRRVLSGNIGAEVDRLTVDAAREEVVRAVAAFDPTLTASGSRGKLRANQFVATAVSAAFLQTTTGFHVNETNTMSLSGGLSQRFATGTEYSVNYTQSRTHSEFSSDLNPRFAPRAVLSLSQPLLAGLGAGQNKADLRLARNSRRSAVHDLEKSMAALLADAERRYWDLVLARENLEVKDQSLRLAEDLLEINRRKFEVGVAAELDVVTAEAGVASQREGIIIARNEVRGAEERLLALTLGPGVPFPEGAVLPTDPAELTEVPVDLARSLGRALSGRAELASALLAEDSARLTERKSRQAMLPGLNLTGSLTENGLGRGSGSSEESLESGRFHDWSVSLEFSMPWGLNAGKAAYRKGRVARRQAELRTATLRVSIEQEVRGAVRNLQAVRERVEATRAAVRLAGEKLRGEQKKFEAGLSTAYNVLQFQEDLADARSRETRAVVDYRLAVTALYQSEGSLLDHYREEMGIVAR